MFLPENHCGLVIISRIASGGVTPSQNCMACGRSRVTARRFSRFAGAVAPDIVAPTKIIEEADMSELLLFTPLAIRGIELRNRIVVPPMHQ